MTLKTNLQKGDLVAWTCEFKTGKVLEGGIVLGFEHKVISSKETLGAKVAWKCGAYWTPVEQLSKVEQ